MKFNYGPFDGQAFPTPDSLFPPDKVVQFILQYGQTALDAMEKLDAEQEKEFIEAMIASGLLERDEKTGALRLTPKMVRGIEHKALLQIFAGLKQGPREGHQAQDRGRGDERLEGTKPYEFGDPLSEIDVAATMRNALRRRPPSDPGKPALPGVPVHYDDFELHQTEGHADTATCILLDQSGSMMRYGRFLHAKKVALGMASLIRRRFAQDTLDYVGFYSLAQRIEERDLPLAMPKPISTYEHKVRLRVPLNQAKENPRLIPQHFTNLQLGLRLARQILLRRPAANKQIFIITDGEPTAHIESHTTGGEEMLHILYPPSERTSTMTLQEGLRCHQADIRIATFALMEDYWGMEWVGFVDQLSRLTHGTALYCAGDDLSSLVIESYLRGRKRKSVSR